MNKIGEVMVQRKQMQVEEDGVSPLATVEKHWDELPYTLNAEVR